MTLRFSEKLDHILKLHCSGEKKNRESTVQGFHKVHTSSEPHKYTFKDFYEEIIIEFGVKRFSVLLVYESEIITHTYM